MIIFSCIINLWLLSLIYRTNKFCETDMLVAYGRFQQHIYGCIKAKFEIIQKVLTKHKKKMQGEQAKLHIKSSIAEKFAERSFNLASSANLGVVALQKALATPRMITREQSKLNQLAKNSVDELFTTKGEYDWLKPLLSDQDLDLLEEIEQKKIKDQMKAPPQ